ncbi:VWA domain-containing protein [Arthrobacter sp. zg-Y1110]|uniref:VWA domain-containing protein n=1 Tax=Arthrobacter sp. zg-Y1110 TaxID=2886932 RepID=UPI001D139BF3|nr:VWA domain-containing protein [Arthrobacter sp. zg-Y1110]MCC3292413.1 VWA domain-containing protein [Arthrobacter sp. zg-Y1110]UWX87151.1 VWA domain-containing protein [Arthrobacter sp. zg-Y1110]
MPLTLDKVAAKAPLLLKKAETAAAAIDLSGLNGQTAKVALVLDFSGSMRERYASGAMQNLAEQVLAMATQFDDDGAIDFFVFDTHAAYLGEISLEDFKGGVNRLTSGRHMGRTNYAEAFLAVRDHFGFNPAKPAPERRGFFGRKKVEAAPEAGPASEPVYALFLTDGNPDNRTEATNALIEVSKAPIFWKFLSVGEEHKDYLQKLDDMPGRFVDNADYKPVGEVDRLTDAGLFEAMLDEFPEWVAEVRSKGLIK